uniref:ULP_PROTEASE domain-containing protein n=1 Tax=Angiostrongylus cantonensis TaxID=6313 RepID=A0A0K0CZG2_ANGCA
MPKLLLEDSQALNLKSFGIVEKLAAVVKKCYQLYRDEAPFRHETDWLAAGLFIFYNDIIGGNRRCLGPCGVTSRPVFTAIFGIVVPTELALA